MMVLTFEFVNEMIVTIQMKALEQFLPVVPFNFHNYAS